MAVKKDAKSMLAALKPEVAKVKPEVRAFVEYPDGDYHGTLAGLGDRISEFKTDKGKLKQVPVIAWKFQIRGAKINGVPSRKFVNKTYRYENRFDVEAPKNDDGDNRDFARYKGFLKQIGIDENTAPDELLEQLGDAGDKREFMEAHGLSVMPTIKFRLKTVKAKTKDRKDRQYFNFVSLLDQSELGEFDDAVEDDLPPLDDDSLPDILDSDDSLEDETELAEETEETEKVEESDEIDFGLDGDADGGDDDDDDDDEEEEEEDDDEMGGDVGLDTAPPYPTPEATLDASRDDNVEFLQSLPAFVEGSLDEDDDRAVAEVAKVAASVIHDVDARMGTKATRLVMKAFNIEGSGKIGKNGKPKVSATEVLKSLAGKILAEA